MARIKKDDQIKILASVNEERRPVRAVAAEFGYTPAAIYALLARSRREQEAGAPVAEQPPLALAATETAPAAPPETPVPEEARVLPFAAMAAAAAAPMPAPVPVVPARAAAEPAPAERGRALGARLAKPGMGLITRSADGDESMMPFRSLDDLLSAIKPILREGARSAEPVWFSIQSIDLAAVDADAA